MIKIPPKRLSVLVLVYLIVLASLSYTIMTKAERPNYVYDWEGILTDEEILEINTLCRDIDTNTTVEIVIITLVSYDEPLKVADIDEARVKYFNEYALDGVTGIGKEDEDNGVLIILSTAMADYGIEVGYGLEGDLTDAECGRIGRYIINKYYVDEDYLSMFYVAVETIGEVVGYGEFAVSPESDVGIVRGGTFLFYGLVVAIIGVLFSIVYIRNQDRKRRARAIERARGREEQRIRASRPRPPPKPVYRFVQCPTCDTKRKAKQKKAKTRELVEEETIFSVLLLTLACLTCGTIITDTRDKRRVETVVERQERRKREREDEEERRKRMEEVRRRQRRREDDDDDNYHSSFSSWGSSSSFGGGGSGGGGASGRLG